MHQLSSVHLASAYTLEFVKKQYKKKFKLYRILEKTLMMNKVGTFVQGGI